MNIKGISNADDECKFHFKISWLIKVNTVIIVFNQQHYQKSKVSRNSNISFLVLSKKQWNLRQWTFNTLVCYLFWVLFKPCESSCSPRARTLLNHCFHKRLNFSQLPSVYVSSWHDYGWQHIVCTRKQGTFFTITTRMIHFINRL